MMTRERSSLKPLDPEAVHECRPRFARGWVGMALVMSLAVATIDFLPLPLETVYVFAAGVTLRESLGLLY